MMDLIEERYVLAAPLPDDVPSRTIGRDRYTDERVWIDALPAESAARLVALLGDGCPRAINAPFLIKQIDETRALCVSVALAGEPLSVAIDLAERWSPMRLARRLYGVMEAVAEVHARGGVLAGPWPSEIWRAPAPSARWVIVKTRRLRHANQPRETQFQAHPRWSAPEALAGDPGAPSDVFSLGAAACALATGRLPFIVTPFARIRQPHAPNGLLDLEHAGLQTLLADMLAFNPADRPSAADVLATLARLIPGPRRTRRERPTIDPQPVNNAHVPRGDGLTTYPPAQPAPPIAAPTPSPVMGACYPLLVDPRGQAIAPDGLAPPRPSRTTDAAEPMPPERSGSPFRAQTLRWAVVVHADEADVILPALGALIALRETQTRVRVLRVEVRDGRTPYAAQRWLGRTYLAAPGLERETFVLIAGDLQAVSLHVQGALSNYAAVGRLAFTYPDRRRAPDAARYARYAAKVVDWHHRASVESRLVLQGTDDGSRALELAQRRLLEPTAKHLRRVRPQTDTAVIAAPTATQLCRGGEVSAPGVLLTVGHGVAAAGADRFMSQGDLRVGQSVLRADDVKAGAFLPGGLWLSVACFGAGTPSGSRFAQWLTKLDDAAAGAVLATLHPTPFVAQLPQAALANPDGPLGVIAHVDLAWSHAFATPTVARDPQGPYRRIADALATLIRASGGAAPIVGRAIRSLQMEVSRFDRLQADTPRVAAARRAEAWLTRHDLDGYMLLGDPAVTLPFGDPATRNFARTLAPSEFGDPPGDE